MNVRAKQVVRGDRHGVGEPLRGSRRVDSLRMDLPVVAEHGDAVQGPVHQGVDALGVGVLDLAVRKA